MTLSFTLMSLVICGLVVVCLNAPSTNRDACKIHFARMTPNPIDYKTVPTSAAVGDFNHDNMLDIAVVYSHTDQLQIFMGSIDEQYSKKMLYSMKEGSKPLSVAVGLLNDDIHLDVVVANFGTHSLACFSGSTNGSLILDASIKTGNSRPIFVTINDLDLDGKTDLIVINYGTNSISIYYAIAYSSFSRIQTIFTGDDSLPISLCINDMNGDNRADIIVVNSGTNTIGVFLQQYYSTFNDKIIYSTGFGSSPSSIVAADFDNDGIQDIAVTNFATKNLVLMIGSRNGTYVERQRIYSLGSLSPRFMCVGALNKDTKLDLVVVGDGIENLALFFGSNEGVFSQPQFYTTGSVNSVFVTTGKLNADKMADFLVVNFDTNNIDVFISRPRWFSEKKELAFNANIRALVTADLNNDQRLDVITSYDDALGFDVSLGYGNGSFHSSTFYEIENRCKSLTAVDINNDTFLDLVLLLVDNMILIFAGDGQGTFHSLNAQIGVKWANEFTVGDFNNDRRLDICVLSSVIDTITILLANENGSYSDYQRLSTMRDPLQLVISDLNNDQNLDIIVLSPIENRIELFFGYGNGTFTEQYSYLTGISPIHLCLDDIDDDGDIDLIIVNSLSKDLTIYRGHGNGSFHDSRTYQTISIPESCAIGDVDDDGVKDIVVSFLYDNKLGIFYGTDDASFTNLDSYSTFIGPKLPIVGDLNMDGRLDILVLHYMNNIVGLLLNEYQYRFTMDTKLSLSSTSALVDMIGRDLNHDHQLDLIVTTYGVTDIGVLFSNGQGSFIRQRLHTFGDNRFNLLDTGDFNGDSILDFVAVSHNQMTTVLFLGNDDETFTPQIDFGSHFARAATDITVADLNNDNKSEVILSLETNDNILVFEPEIVNYFEKKSIIYPSLGPISISVGDFNHDNRLDFVSVCYQTDEIEIFLGIGDGNFTRSSTLSADRGSFHSAIKDVNGDQELDIVVVSMYNSSIFIFLGDGHGNFNHQMLLDNYLISSYVAIEDINQDDRQDILVTNIVNESISIFLATADAHFEDSIKIYIGCDPISMKAIDINHDNQLDIIVLCSISTAVRVLFGLGNQTFTYPAVYRTGANPSSFDAQDLNKDGYIDLVISNFGDNTLTVLFGISNGLFRDSITITTGSSPVYVKIEDLNNDDKQDIVFTNQGDNNFGIVFGNGDGTFSTMETFPTDSNPLPFALGKFNDDEMLDIIVGNFWSHSLSIYFGNPKYVLKLRVTLETEALISEHSLATGDFNNDGLLDIAVACRDDGRIGIFFNRGNFNFSKQYFHSIGVTLFPSSIVVADFNLDNATDILVTDTSANTLILLFSRGNGAFMLPYLISTGINTHPRTAFPFDFNHDNILDIAFINSVTDNIEILFGYGDGHFDDKVIVVVPLGSQPSSFTIGDVNGDMKPDIVVLNSRSDNINVFLFKCY